ncbi:MAG: PilX N-terminal domain-containing pilus assembly protein [Thermodesulfobacteriota bacterium]
MFARIIKQHRQNPLCPLSLRSEQGGFILVTVVVMLALLAVLGLLLLTTSTKDLRITANLYWGKQAFYAADAGINMAMFNVEDFIFGGTDALSIAAPVTVDPANNSDTATYTYQGTKRTSGSLPPRAGYEVGAWAGAGFDLSATGQAGMAQSQIEVLSRATVPIDAYTGGK